MFHKFGHVFSQWRLLSRATRDFTPRYDITTTCHCERTEAILFRTGFLTSPYLRKGVVRLEEKHDFWTVAASSG